LSVYVLDTNVFIQAHRLYYPFDVAPGFWDSLIEFGQKGIIHSIDWVRNEIIDGKDELAEWVKGDGAILFRATITSNQSNTVIAAYARVGSFVKATARYQDIHRESFLAGADGWVVAYAQLIGGTVVTMEQPARTGAKVKIPDVCEALGVPWITTYDMLRNLGVRLGLI